MATLISNDTSTGGTQVALFTQPDVADSACISSSLSTSPEEERTSQKYQPFLLDEHIISSDWISRLELTTVSEMAHNDRVTAGKPLRILVLYGSLRTRCDWLYSILVELVNMLASRSYSRLLAFEAARIFHRLGCDVRVFNPAGLPVKDSIQDQHPKVQELRGLSEWSDGHFWVSPEQHGNLVRTSSCAPTFIPATFHNTTHH
jgi:arsenical resistance protein ArsH